MEKRVADSCFSSLNAVKAKNNGILIPRGQQAQVTLIAARINNKRG